MQAQDKSRIVHIRWAILALCLLILTSCTVLCTHIDKNCSDDGKGHCSLCLSAAAHGVQPRAAVQTPAPTLLVSDLILNADPLIKQERFATSLYIRPPPLS
jgi:hypothetical protein